jgi:hypothetical protein
MIDRTARVFSFANRARSGLVNPNSAKSQDFGIGLGRAFSFQNDREMAVFETCGMLRPRLEMYSFAPIKDTGRSERTTGGS